MSVNLSYPGLYDKHSFDWADTRHVTFAVLATELQLAGFVSPCLSG